MQAVFDLARAAARSQSTVLVLGESGTGKEVLARANPPRESPRGGPLRRRLVRRAARDAPRVRALRPREGAFTGASSGERASSRPRRTARCSSTRSATSARSSSSTCCACSRTGGSTGWRSESIEVDVRIIAATNRDLRKAVADGKFAKTSSTVSTSSHQASCRCGPA